MTEKCIYKEPTRCCHPKVKNIPQFEFKESECGNCLNRILPTSDVKHKP